MRLTVILVGVATLFCAPVDAFAFQILGRVVNGTTGEGVTSATIKVVNPSGGMLVEREVETTDDSGRFQIDGLSEDVPVYLLRVTYQGVNYTEISRFEGADPQTIEIPVYELTESWERVHVAVPHMMLVRSGDTLTVDKFIQIENHTSPPRTVYGEESKFTIYLPPDLVQINGISVRSFGIPLAVTPEPTDEAGLYTIDYPIKPGQTPIQVSIDLPYQSGEYKYSEPMMYDLRELLVISQDPTIDVTSETIDVGDPGDFHGFKSYELADLRAGQTLDLTFRGGSASSVGANPSVLVVANSVWKFSLVVTVFVTLMLLGFLGVAVRKGRSASEEQEELNLQKEELLNQLARLDDLHKAGTVSDQMYKLKRNELTNALAGVYYHTSFERNSDTAKSNKEGAARV